MSRFVRPSKYRHICPNPAKKEASYENVKVSNNAWDTNLIQANGKFISVNWQASGGGAFAVIPISRPGKLPDIYPLCRGHTAVVLDTAFSPFDDSFIASASDDGTVGLWKMNDADFEQLDWTDKERERKGGIKDFQPLARISGGGRKVGQVAFHPTASNVLSAATGDHVVKLFDVTTASSAPSSPSISLRGFTDSIQSLDFDWTGTTIIATSRDRKLRTFDPRQGENPVQVADGHGGVKGARVIWCGDKDRAITTGFSKMSDRQMFLWDTKNLSSGPLKSITLDTSSGIIMPFWSDNGVVYLGGKGDGNVRLYELESDELHYLTESKSSDPQRGLTFVGRRFLNSDENEVARAYKITGSMIQPVSFNVPRKAESFQADIYPPASSSVPALNAQEFFHGKRAARNLIDFESGKNLSGGSVPSVTTSAPGAKPAAAPAATSTPATTRFTTTSAPSATPSSPTKASFAQSRHEGTARSEAMSTFATLKKSNAASTPGPTSAPSNGSSSDKDLLVQIEKLKVQVKERDTKIRELELENEQLKTKQARAREALLNSF